MDLDIYTWQQEIEQRLKVYSLIISHLHQVSYRFFPDPLSLSIIKVVPRYHKLEALILALTLLRYSDVSKLNIPSFLEGNPQIIMQGKTKTEIEIPRLFLPQSPLAAITFPAVNPFTESYDKLRYSLLNSIPTELREQLKTNRTVTHIFRFLRAGYMHIQKKDLYFISKYLGHKDPDSLNSYVPSELINYYSNYLLKG